jgi:hypothetical protein
LAAFHGLQPRNPGGVERCAGFRKGQRRACWPRSWRKRCPPGIKHKEIDHSEDFEVLEITMPADFETKEVK